ncbi:hypothetical protein AB0J72_08065 [Dactylosporangium sp. NPDC049742]|uniref:hypothetical protein n=1 Tax=Dactylosporangium sp. NPDC049742 TaxID=3154737 RepID=UPI0034313F1D
MLLEPLAEVEELTDYSVLRTFLAPCLLVAASVLALAGITVAAGNRLSATPPPCTRVTAQPARSACP